MSTLGRAERRARVVALVFQAFKHSPTELAAQTREELGRNGLEARLHSVFDLKPDSARDLDLVVTFGGDGTVLRVARWLAGAGAAAPIVPVRMGSLSFLGELTPEQVPDRLHPYLEGDYWLDERTMLAVETDGRRALALNDAVIGRGAASRAVRLDLWVDEAFVSHYVADGLVLASPTGSTGYALAAGGPVLAPGLNAIIIQPVAPHLASLRSLVVPGSSAIRVLMHTYQPGVLTLDGQIDYVCSDGQQTVVTTASERAYFARRGGRADFYRDLAARLTR